MIISVFQFACDVKAEVIGKPSSTFFLTALDKIQVLPEDVSVSWILIWENFSPPDIIIFGSFFWLSSFFFFFLFFLFFLNF